MKKLSSLLARITLFSFRLLAVAPAISPVLLSEANAASAISGDFDGNALVTTMCQAMQLVDDSTGIAFAAFTIILFLIDFSFFTGKISLGLMIGLALMFGTPTIFCS